MSVEEDKEHQPSDDDDGKKEDDARPVVQSERGLTGSPARKKSSGLRASSPPQPDHVVAPKTAWGSAHKRGNDDGRNKGATNRTEPAIFFADLTRDRVHLNGAPYRGGNKDDFVHFCGPRCDRVNCKNVGPPGLSKTLAMRGVCEFCLNTSREDIHVNRECNAGIHVIRVGTPSDFVWVEVLNPATTLPSSGKSLKQAIKEVDKRFKEGKERQEFSAELKESRDTKVTIHKGIKEINLSARDDPEAVLSSCDRLIKYTQFNESLDRKAGEIKGALDRSLDRRRQKK